MLKKNIYVIFVFFIFISCSNRESSTVIKLAHSLDVSHPVHRAMVFMSEKVKEKSGGKMIVDIYPGGQLGNERELIELLQIGSLAMTKVSTAPLEGFIPDMKIFGMPYLFQDDQHRWNVLNGPIGKKLLVSGESYFLKGMCYYDAGSRSFYTKNRSIKTPSDLKGMKIRVQKSQTSINMVKSLGGSATPIPWGELYTSLQQGVVDGAENNPPSFHLSKHYEVCKFYSLDEHTSIPDVLIMSTHVWSSLSQNEKIWLQTSIDESVIYQKKLWLQATKEALDKIKNSGVEVIYPDKKLFQESVKSMYDNYKNESFYKLIGKIKNHI
tara:strand:+ start:1308 stop:2279 length:972 start_codon:yes stop_codon:yes gene_type:complete